MRAVVVESFGGPEVLQVVDRPPPRAATGELVVEVAAADVLFLDTQLRAGGGGDWFPIEPPFVPGVAVVGTVCAVGDGADPAWLGCRVLADTSAPGTYGGGGYAELAVVPQRSARRVPDGVDDAAALAARDGSVALTRLDPVGLRAGDTAAVTAASGSIGTWLVPLLARDGVRVVALARGEQKTRLAAERGADVVADYGVDEWLERLTREVGTVDAVFDGAGGALGEQTSDLLRDGGTFSAYGSAAGAFADVAGRAAGRGVRVIGIHDDLTPEQADAAVERALALVASGEVRPVIGQRLPLEEAAAAHAAMEERRVLGKTVLVPTGLEGVER